ncbi:DNA repair protein RadC [Chitinophagales bacterium]|nr:DNA repair protein RadC [Chitinophagales bacterium]
MKKNEQAKGIKNWSEEDRPRERLLQKGARDLSDAELIAILLGSGSQKETAVDLAKRMLAKFDHNLKDLGKMGAKDLQQFRGVGAAKAATMLASFELGKRRQSNQATHLPQIKSSKDAYEIMQATLGELPHEEFWILLLNRANKVMGRERISVGGVAGTIADIKIILKRAIDCLASSIILLHNHPSGNLRPSMADERLTKKVDQAAKLMDIAVLDHLIISDEGYYSFADSGKMGGD